jgi:carbon-monoxide dehydrogenase large subunit
MVAVVEVDVETGQVRIDQLVCAEDCGNMMNPMIVDGQLTGATAQGIGAVLLEGQPYGEDGQPRATTLMDFLYPTATDIPRLQIEHLCTPSPHTEGGFKGMAEGGNIAAPAAIVNAIQDALAPLGISIEETPLGPGRLRDLIRTAAG